MKKREKLVAARFKKGLSQEVAAGLVGVSRNTWNDWERGKATPHPLNVGELCKFFGVKDPGELDLEPRQQDNAQKTAASSFPTQDKQTTTLHSPTNSDESPLKLKCEGRQMDGKKLREARIRKHLTQERAAEALHVSSVTYYRWEKGETTPHGFNAQVIEEVLGITAEDLGIVQKQEEISLIGFSTPQLAVSTPNLQAFLSEDLEMRLWSLASQPFHSYRGVSSGLSRILKEDDTMHASHPNHHIKRRDALSRLVALPFAALGFEALDHGRELPPSHEIEEVLSRCAVSLAACWEQLCKSHDIQEMLLAFESVSKYLPALRTIVKESAAHRPRAADLTARCALLKTILAWHCVGLTEATQAAKEAIIYSKEAGKATLQISAYCKLAWTYFYMKQYTLALSPAQQAAAIVEQVEDRATTVPASLRGGTYSTLALMQAKNGLPSDTSLGKAIEIDPGDESIAFMMFTRSDVPMETGLIYSASGNQLQAMAAFEQIISPESLELKMPWTERGRIEVINNMAMATIKSKDRDKERVIHYWTHGIEAAKALRSEQRFNELLSTYEFMETIWSSDKEIEDLRSLTVHW